MQRRRIFHCFTVECIIFLLLFHFVVCAGGKCIEKSKRQKKFAPGKQSLKTFEISDLLSSSTQSTSELSSETDAKELNAELFTELLEGSTKESEKHRKLIETSTSTIAQAQSKNLKRNSYSDRNSSFYSDEQISDFSLLKRMDDYFWRKNYSNVLASNRHSINVNPKNSERIERKHSGFLTRNKLDSKSSRNQSAHPHKLEMIHIFDNNSRFKRQTKLKWQDFTSDNHFDFNSTIETLEDFIISKDNMTVKSNLNQALKNSIQKNQLGGQNYIDVEIYAKIPDLHESSFDRFVKTLGQSEEKLLDKNVALDNDTKSENETEIGIFSSRKKNKCTFSPDDLHFVVCDGERITKVPSNLSNRTVETLTLSKTNITTIDSASLWPYRKTLKNFNIEDHKHLHTIDPDAFSKIENLQSVSIKGAPLLKTIDPLVLSNCPTQFSLEIIKSGLERAVKIVHKKDKVVHHLQFDNNRLRVIEPYTFQVYVEIMSINYNFLESIEDNAFNDSHIGHLSLRGNHRLTRLSERAFQNIHTLNKLLYFENFDLLRFNDRNLHVLECWDLSETSIIKLPTLGLKDIEVLRITNTYSLKVLPSFIFQLTEVKEAHLTYPYHCCAFQFPRKQPEFAAYNQFFNHYCLDKVSTTTLTPFDIPIETESEWIATPFDFAKSNNTASNQTQRENQIVGTFSNDSFELTSFFIKHCGRIAHLEKNPVICTPKPDAFNPCEDIMGNNWLRITVWFVLIAALFGNFSVFIILFSGKLPITVSKFLMCNLAIADFLMGVYLFIIAIFDLKTMGAYFNYAIDWQHGLGCKVAGFITVFSSELSIYTLTVITMERYFPIAYPLQLDKRLKLSFAIKVMLVGWLYSVLMATLPIVGISSYSKVSICLPMETRNWKDIAYLVFILCFSFVDFILICACYGKMYLSIISQKTRATNNDTKVAKGMALLVFTDFACFMPITFFGLTAIAGYPLIDVTRSKILLVFFFPLNSMANPFLYTITKQFRRDFYLLASRFGLCTGKALRLRSGPTCAHLNHLAYYRHHRHNHGKCLATIGSATMNSGSSSNCQSIIPAYSDYNTNSNSYSASISQLSNGMHHNDPCLNSRCSLENVKGGHSKMQRYYRKSYPHHEAFYISKQFNETELFEPCCSKYKRKDHEKHMHCYHHHHKKHPHSAPVSQANEPISVGQESNSDHSGLLGRATNQTESNQLNSNKYLNNALSTSILYTNNQNISSCSSSADHCGVAVTGDGQAKRIDLDRAYCSSCANKKSMIKCLTLFKHNYLFHNRDRQEHDNLHGNLQDLRKVQNEIGSLTTGTTFDSTFTANNPTALTHLSLDSCTYNEHIEFKKINQNERKKSFVDKDKLLNHSLTIITQNTTTDTQNTIAENIKNETNKNSFQRLDSLQSANILTNNLNMISISKTGQAEPSQQKQKNSPFESSYLRRTKSNNESCKKPSKKAKQIKFKFKLSSSKQQSRKTNEFELHKLKNTKSNTLTKSGRKNVENNQLLRPSACLDRINQLPVSNAKLKDVNSSEDIVKIEKFSSSEKSIDEIDHLTNAKKKNRTRFEELIDNQSKTKPKILKKWINFSKKKCDHNCHTNFKLIKNDFQNQLKNEQKDLHQTFEPETCQSITQLNEVNNNSIRVLKKNEEAPKKKHSLLASKLISGYSGSKDSLFGRILLSLTSSSSTSNNASNPSGNTSDNMSIRQNSISNDCANVDGINDKVNRKSSMNTSLHDKSLSNDTPESDHSKLNKSSYLKCKEMKNSKSFNSETIDTENFLANNSIKKLNLSLSSLETSPRRLTIKTMENSSDNEVKI